jgi:hypothetical protein
MANDGQIVFEVTADGKKAKAAIRDITKDIKAESKKWDDAAEQSTENIGNGFSSMLKKIGGAIVAAKIGQKLLQIGKEAVQLASDLEEVQNVVDVTFGSGAREIESWSKTAGTQFGLTETQAKRFASTMGAMMKSSGLAGDEIVDMSKDLAGLAADMASFYNLDFDTAFQKIRSGISGETEPLKQLGINMSVANLNAYALQKGLSKTFEKMTQGEQTMLRYQYMMEATSDAQGDFARTSEGYANSTRTFETNIATLKTSIGTLLEHTLNPLLNAVNEFFSEGEKRRSVLDDINDIQIETEEKIAKIKSIADKATELKTVLEEIGKSNSDTVITNIASGANILDSSSPTTWKALAGALQDVDGLHNIFGGSGAKQNIEDLANALSSTTLDGTKADAWKTFLGALSENADAVSKLTGKSAEETAEWLKGLADAADELSPTDAEAWDTLLSSLVSGISLETPEGKKFVESLSTQFLAMGKDSEDAVNGLSMLGFSTDQIAEKQETWLKTCKDLVRTIPGLSDIINAETGEIKGGTGALSDYVKEWQGTQEKIAKWKAYYRMRDKLDEANGGLYELEMTKNAYKRLLLENSPDLADYADMEGALSDLVSGGGYGDIGKKFVKAFEAWETASTGAAASTRVLDVAYQELVDEYGEMTEAEANAADSMEGWSESAKAAGKNAVESVREAVTALDDYVKSVNESMKSAVDNVVKGFGEIETPMMKNRKQVKDLTDQIAGLDTKSKTYTEDLAKLNAELSSANGNTVSAQSMGANLKQQAEYMDKYLEYLRLARSKGVSNEVLAALSDGSEESYDYLEALANASDGEVETINANYQAVIDKKKELTDELTAQQLTVDDTYLSLAEKAKQAVAELDMEELAAENTGKTVRGMAQGIADHVGEVQDAVDQIVEQLDRLTGLGISVDLGQFGTISLSGTGVSTNHGSKGNESTLPVHSYAVGTDYVPYDMLARIHEGEAVLTAEENKVWQMMKNGNLSGVDYDSLGGVMRDNIKPGGNVYIDGRIVGSVVSDRQGKSYKSLQRSGWQQ